MGLRNIIFICISIIFFSCGNDRNENPEGVLTSHFVYENKYAKGFRISAGEEYTRIDIYNPLDSSENIDTYYLYTKEQGIPDIKDSLKLFEIPVGDAGLFSTTFAAYFDHLDLTSKIKGIAFADLVKNENLKNQIDNNFTVNLSSGEEIDLEKLLALQADLFMVYPYQNVNLKRYSDLGIKTVLNLEYQEQHPLARAEWIKFVSIFYGKYDHATEDFAHIEEEYLSLKSKVALEDKPTVFTGSNYKGTWYAPGSDSYIAAFINDAGGEYVFKEYSGRENISLNFETAFEQIHEADYWGNVFFEKGRFTTQTLLDIDERYAELKAIQEKHVFYCNTNESDYFGDAIMEPEIILADLISIFHPGILEGHKNKYFFLVEE